MKIALIGNPNVGKSTVFNALTGSNQQVGNWAGKTVERKSGVVKRASQEIELIDLPGTYSLTAYSQEEIITREYIIREKPDVVMAMVDASNIERNLYLVLQILELVPRVVIGLNMLDLAQSAGITIESSNLALALNVPVVEIVAAKGKGIEEFLTEAIRVGKLENDPLPNEVSYPKVLEQKILAMEALLVDTLWVTRYPLRWLAIKRLERDPEIGQTWKINSGKLPIGKSRDACCDLGEAVNYELQESTPLPGESLLQDYEREGWTKDHFEMAIADAKYQYISAILPQFRKHENPAKPTFTDRLDRWILSPFWGYPIMLVVLTVVFWMSFIASAPIGGAVSLGMAWVAEVMVGWLQWVQAPEFMQSLVRDGIFAGVGAVLAFVPQIAIFFALFSFMQDSGYLARAAFLGDRFMQLMGLHGKSFFSLISSFGCNVPGIMATRTLEDPKDRLITILINPLIPCVPRLGVMSAVVAAFFPGSRGALIMISLLLISMLLVMFSALFLRRVVKHTERSAFVMELPLYHIPTVRNILVPTWQKTYSFLKRAWTFILVASIVVWILSSYPQGVPMSETWAGIMGGWLAFIGQPLGFDWRIMVAIVFGFTAKETTLSTLGILYGVAADASQSIAQAMTGAMTPLGAYTFLVVYMLYIPCLASVVTTYKESRNLGWTSFGVAYSLILSFVMGWIVFHGGQALGFR
ncbi:ferrous iron transport protein B [Desulfosporosinus sp. BICA1-9]|uniref:ferrous iron transport protein B n=1 Tax=Desulfosporosinus sp. BICA1-9 TaxID=1531958 RepID=UPI00054B0DB7|nr:ferrous iron transport protein B [Desulfosporosinus sp. BICA1-9]KJS50418.1 MAG: iron transporter [Peptococcaceae bacterium BRH_c23]KJS82252.1 MAG: iron transporter [Desulfosporosinus sp. BICA1-9]KJS88992.1 MAG: iron transporter [Desulfosporosinus sp. BICA1-9]HBW37984.1 ferrous iron transport protein B [Desulfosporosinus sp.]